jgi:hypothetical protein
MGDGCKLRKMLSRAWMQAQERIFSLRIIRDTESYLNGYCGVSGRQIQRDAPWLM